MKGDTWGMPAEFWDEYAELRRGRPEDGDFYYGYIAAKLDTIALIKKHTTPYTPSTVIADEVEARVGRVARHVDVQRTRSTSSRTSSSARCRQFDGLWAIGDR